MTTEERVSRVEPLLGTVVEIRVVGDDAVTDDVVTEIQRLERIFSVYDQTSELSRWRAGADPVPGVELTEVLVLAHRWHLLSGGAFNVGTGRLTRVWRDAAARGEEPSDADIASVVASIADPPYEIADGTPVRTADCSTIDLNALAKGWIVDRAVEHVAARCDRIVVNAGGDLAHSGEGSVVVGFEDPHRPYDNVPPMVRVTVSNAAVATSGSTRRGVRIGGRRYGHVLDPRTGRPVDVVASVSIVGPNAATADVLATVVGVTAAHDVDAALAIADDHRSAALLVLADRTQRSTSSWADLVV